MLIGAEGEGLREKAPVGPARRLERCVPGVFWANLKKRGFRASDQVLKMLEKVSVADTAATEFSHQPLSEAPTSNSRDVLPIPAGARPALPELRAALAGLQAGTLGGVIMLAYFSVHSLLQHQPWWSMPNLLGTAVYGQTALWRGLGRATLAGAAFQLLIAGAVGALFGLLFAKTRHGAFGVLAGLLAGALCFFLCHEYLFAWISPLIPVYASRPSALMGHLLLGLSFSGAGAIYRRQQAS